MTVQSAKQRFLDRVEIVRIRVPFEQTAINRLNALKAERQKLVDDYEEAKKADRKLSDKPVPEPKLDALDKKIAAEDKSVDNESIIVVLRYRPKIAAPLLNQSRKEDWSYAELLAAMAAGYYERAEILGDNGEWEDLGLDWEEVEARITDGDITQIGQAAFDTAQATDAAPFNKRGTTSAAT